MKDKNVTELLAYAKEQLLAGATLDQVEKLLQQTGNEALSSEVIAKLKKERHEESLKKGLIKLGIAASLLFFSFVYSCIHFHSNEPFTMVMYCFTSAGMVLLLWGCYDIFN